ncbi:MAG: glycosyltransferase family 2 protein [Clostridia bacterium]|nr:glycosyltransferase family 2 protein [Clostridia bacterium]
MTTAINVIITVITVISSVISALYLPKALYVIAGLFTTRKFQAAQNCHKYAILVAARNEEAVVGNLLESIRRQDYPGELTTFVVADNCTDNTAQIVRDNGAVCYERFDSEHRTKGFALQFLLENIARDYGENAFEGYFIFDADNLLRSDFVSKMNDAFDSGAKIITSYRNTKNFDDNWISSSYALHWMRTIRTTNRGISALNLTTRLQGTGFLFAAETIRKQGWIYTSLTEDRAMSADTVADGYRITYQNDAEFYDEQPTVFRQAMRQRIRWAKGHIQAFGESGGKLFRGTFKAPASVQNFCCFDMLTTIYPRSVVTFFKNVLLLILRILLVVLAGFLWGPFLGLFISIGLNFLYSWGSSMLTAIYVMVTEHRHIPKLKWYRAVWHVFMFPMFDIIGKISMLIALFMHVEWKPIVHDRSVTIDEIDGK